MTTNDLRRGAWVVYRNKVVIAVLGYDMATKEAQIISDAPGFLLDRARDYAEAVREGEVPDPYTASYGPERWEHQELLNLPEGTLSGALQFLWLSSIDRT